MTTGRDLLGEQPTARLKVWYHNGEDPLEEMQRRLVAICQHYGVPQTELQGWLFLTSGNQFPLRVADGYGKLTLDTKLLARLEEQIRATEIDVAIFDPLVTLHSVQESDNTAMNVVLSAFRTVADNATARSSWRTTPARVPSELSVILGLTTCVVRHPCATRCVPPACSTA